MKNPQFSPPHLLATTILLSASVSLTKYFIKVEINCNICNSMTDLFPDIIISMAVLHLQLFPLNFIWATELSWTLMSTLSDGQCHKRNTCMQVKEMLLLTLKVPSPLPQVQSKLALTSHSSRPGTWAPKLLCPFQSWVLGPHSCWNSPWKGFRSELCIPEVSENWLEKTDAIKKKWWLNQMKQCRSKKVSRLCNWFI